MWTASAWDCNDSYLNAQLVAVSSTHSSNPSASSNALVASQLTPPYATASVHPQQERVGSTPLHEASTANPPALRILVLHGLTYSSSWFHAKTGTLRAAFDEAFPGTAFAYPTGPMRVQPDDLEDFVRSALSKEDLADSFSW